MQYNSLALYSLLHGKFHDRSCFVAKIPFNEWTKKIQGYRLTDAKHQKVSFVRKYHNHATKTKPCHRVEETQNNNRPHDNKSPIKTKQLALSSSSR